MSDFSSGGVQYEGHGDALVRLVPYWAECQRLANIGASQLDQATHGCSALYGWAACVSIIRSGLEHNQDLRPSHVIDCARTGITCPNRETCMEWTLVRVRKTKSMWAGAVRPIRAMPRDELCISSINLLSKLVSTCLCKVLIYNPTAFLGGDALIV